jgi:hypothetical protein
VPAHQLATEVANSDPPVAIRSRPRDLPVASPESLKMSVDEYKLHLVNTLSEYIQSSDLTEVVRRLTDGRLSSPISDASEYIKVEFVKRAVYMSMDRSEDVREMLMSLISSLEIRGILRHSHIEKALGVYTWREYCDTCPLIECVLV